MKRFLHKKFYHTLFFSYLTLLLLCLAIGVLLFHSSLTQIEENAEQFNHAALSQVTAAFTKLRVTIRNRMDELHTRDAHPSLVYASNPITNAKLIQVAELQKELIRQTSYDTYISGIYIWFEHPQIAATTSGLYRSKDAFDKMLTETYGVSLQELSDWSGDISRVCIKAIGSNGTVEKMLAVIPRKNGIYSSMEIIELRVSAVAALLSAENGDSSTFFWAVLENDSLLIESQYDIELARNITAQSLASDKISRIEYNGQDLAVMHTEGTGGLSFYSVSAFSAYSQMYHSYTVMAIIYLAVYIAIGLIFSALLSRRNYKPIERLNNILLDKTANSADDGEFALLEASINSLLKSSRDYSRMENRERKLSQERCMVSLLSGALSEADFAKACSEYSLQFSSARFAVVGIVVKDYSNLFLDGKSHRDDDAKGISMFAVASVAGELLEECGSAYTCTHNGKVWVVVSPKPGKGLTEQDITEQLSSCCRRSEAFLREQLGISTAYCFSKFSAEADGVSGISGMYQECLWGLEQIEGYGMETAVNSTESITAMLKPDTTQPADDISAKRRQLFSAVTAGDFDEADKLYMELRRQDLAFSGESFSAVRTQTLVLMGYLLSNLSHACIEAHKNEIDNFTRAIRQEQHDDNLTELVNRWFKFYNDLYNETKSKGEKEDTALLAAHYINDHYTNPDLSVAMVAEALSVSASYLSRVFRKRYDTSVLDYIHDRRIETSKVLLRESDITVLNVAEQVGYTNALALIRAFKRSEECTPTEYRKSLQK